MQEELRAVTQPQQGPAPATTEAARPRRATLELLDIIGETEMRQQYAREIVTAELARDLFDQDWRLARVFAMSGMFADLKQATQEEAIAAAMAKIQMGRSWGLSPADSIRFVYFNNGKPNVETEIIASRLRSKGYDWDITWHEDPKKVCIGCTLWLKRADAAGAMQPLLDRDGKPISVGFTKQDADAAMVWEKGKQIPLSEKWNFVSWPRDMYFARSISRVKKYHVPDVFCGAVTREEAEDLPAAGEEPEPRPYVFDPAELERVTQQRIAEESAKLEAFNRWKGKHDSAAESAPAERGDDPEGLKVFADMIPDQPAGVPEARPDPPEPPQRPLRFSRRA